MSGFGFGLAAGMSGRPPAAAPVNHDFTTGTLPVGWSVDRASANATYYDGDGVMQVALADVARFTYIDGEGPYLLIEPEATNLLAHTTDYTNAYWISSLMAIDPDEVTAPDDVMTGNHCKATTDNGNHYVFRTPALGVNGQHVFSVHAKAHGYSNFALREAAETGARAAFDADAVSSISTGSAGGVTVSDVQIEPAAAGFNRFAAVFDLTASASGFGLWFLSPAYVAGDPHGQPWAGDDASGVDIWGVQAEAGNVLTSFIYGPATRAEEVLAASIPAGGATLRFTFADDSTPDIEVDGGIITLTAADFNSFALAAVITL